MPISRDVRASCFAHYGEKIRKRSLRHHALVTATFQRHFGDLGTYAALSSRWSLQQAWMTAAESCSVPAGSGSLPRPHSQRVAS